MTLLAPFRSPQEACRLPLAINLVLNFPNFPNNVPFSTFPRSWEPQPRGERREALTREDTTQDLRYFIYLQPLLVQFFAELALC